MSPNESIKTCFQKFFDFKGRASRSEFWWFTAIIILISIIAASEVFYSSEVLTLLATIILLITIIPNISVGVRRLHDVNKSGFWFAPFILMLIIPDRLLYAIPHLIFIFSGLMIFYMIVLIYWLTLKGDESHNEFGKPPSSQDQT